MKEARLKDPLEEGLPRPPSCCMLFPNFNHAFAVYTIMHNLHGMMHNPTPKHLTWSGI